MKRLLGFLAMVALPVIAYASSTPAPTRLTNTVIVGDGTTGSKYVKFDAGQGGVYWNGTTLKLSNDGTTFMTLQSGNNTLATQSLAETLANKTINNANIHSSSLDQSVIYDARADRFTLFDTAVNTKELNFDLSGITAANSRVLAAPDYDGTISVLNHAQTFTATETFSSAGHVVMNDPGGKGGNVPHSISYQTFTTSGVGTVTICCDGSHTNSQVSCSVPSTVAVGGGCEATSSATLERTMPAFGSGVPRGWFCESNAAVNTTAHVICMSY